MRLSVLLPTARPEFGVKDNWNYKVPTLLSMSTLITAGLEDLQIQKKLEHVAYPERHPQRSPLPRTGSAKPRAALMNNPSTPGQAGTPKPPPAQLTTSPTIWTFLTVGESRPPLPTPLMISARAPCTAKLPVVRDLPQIPSPSTPSSHNGTGPTVTL